MQPVVSCTFDYKHELRGTQDNNVMGGVCGHPKLEAKVTGRNSNTLVTQEQYTHKRHRSLEFYRKGIQYVGGLNNKQMQA